MFNKNSYVYIVTNKNNTVLYIEVTSDLEKRIYEHKTKFDPKSFSAKYNVDKLVYFECYSDITDAIAREKQLKAGSRKKKLDLIDATNADWIDLAKDWYLEDISTHA